jgi:hypothetical protein
MGFLDRVKQIFGGGSSEGDEPDEATSSEARGDRGPLPERPPPGARRPRGKGGDRERPPLAEVQPPSQSVEDALTEREAGRKAEARKILIEIDRGGGLRTVLRAAAALEVKDEDEVRELLPRVAREEPRWRLTLQVAAALGDPTKAKPLIEEAAKDGAPPWALAWSRAAADDEKERREGLVELLFVDAPLARTVAARDLNVPGVTADGEAGARYAAFAHGRDSIRRFGAEIVAEVLSRARAAGGGR